MPFTQFFQQHDDLAYCSDICGLMNQFRIEYRKADWRLFIDLSKISLKAVLLHNGNTYASLPLAHSVEMKETYDNMKILLKEIKYDN